MVRGIDLFRDHFADFTDYFTLIGGAACELTLTGTIGFRATKDIDILVLLEKVDRDFAEQFHRFITTGNYSCYISKDENRHFYRFLTSGPSDFPPQIELLSRTLFPEYPDMKYTPLAEDSYVKSMSAIILGTEYYNYAQTHRVMQRGLPCLDTDALIVFKSAAYLNLREQREKDPKSVRSEEITKHRNDVFRLLTTVIPGQAAEVPEIIKVNLQRFINSFPADDAQWQAIRQSLGAIADTPENYLRVFNSHFQLEQ